MWVLQGHPHFSRLLHKKRQCKPETSVVTGEESDREIPIKAVYLGSPGHYKDTFSVLIPFFPPLYWYSALVSSLRMGLVLLAGFPFFSPHFTGGSSLQISAAELGSGVLQTLWSLSGIFLTFIEYLQDVREFYGISRYLIKDVSCWTGLSSLSLCPSPQASGNPETFRTFRLFHFGYGLPWEVKVDAEELGLGQAVLCPSSGTLSWSSPTSEKPSSALEITGNLVCKCSILFIIVLI